jgi:hypothetical protein
VRQLQQEAIVERQAYLTRKPFNELTEDEKQEIKGFK